MFSGDVGNIDQPILNDPLPVAETDYLVVESTYGNRLHDKPKDVRAELTEVLQRAFDRGGSVIIPAFAVGRTQELLYLLREIKQKSLYTATTASRSISTAHWPRRPPASFTVRYRLL